MNGAADLGGMMGFGPVVPEPEDVRFHAEWERTALAITLAIGPVGRWNMDQIRQARESLPPAEYLTSSYFAIWVKALERQLVETGLVDAAELAAGRSLAPGVPVTLRDVPAVLAAGTPYNRPAERAARFAPDQPVRTRVMNPTGHTRLPRYARGRCGVIERVHGVHVFPDSNAQRAGKQPQWVYTVRFAARELWGADADADLTIAIDAWESYLEPV